MTSGFFRLLPDLPKPFWRYPISYLSYGSWSVQVITCDTCICKRLFHKATYQPGLVCHLMYQSVKMIWQGAYKNDFLGLEFEPMIAGEPKLSGEYVIQHTFGISLEHSKWWDLVAIAAILVSYRVLFFLILKFKESASPLFQTLYAKRILHHLDKRPSFRKKPSFPSNRHQPLHSLSSQEGLNSPLN